MSDIGCVNAKNKGKLIVIDGIDGAGKGLAIKYSQEIFKSFGIEVCLLRDPGSTLLGEKLRRLLLKDKKYSARDKIDKYAELLLFFSIRVQLISKSILPLLKNGHWVLCDRFTDSTYAYQGEGRGIPRRDIEAIENIVQKGVRPDLTIILDIKPEDAIGRKNSDGLDNIEALGESFFKRARNCYLFLAKEDKERYKVIHSGDSRKEVKRQLYNVIHELIKKE